MLEIGRCADLGEESLGAQRFREIILQHFHGDLSLVFDVVREEDGGHAADAEFALDEEAAGEGGVEAVGLLGHVGHG